MYLKYSKNEIQELVYYSNYNGMHVRKLEQS